MRLRILKHASTSVSALCVVLLWSTHSMAALNIPDSPLFLTSTGVKPNVVMTIDDSGSMRRGWTPESVTNNQQTIDGPRFKSPSVNGMYYNPRLVYLTPTRSDGTSYSTSFTSAYFNGFDTSRGSGINLGTSYKVVGQATPEHTYSSCDDTLVVSNNTDCRLVKHPATITSTAHTATGCTITFDNYRNRRGTPRNEIQASGSSSCSSIFSGIPQDTRVTINATNYTVSSRQSNSTIRVRETVADGTISSATVTWSSTSSSGGGTSGVAAYYYLYYGDKPSATRPSNCNDSRANDSCYVKVVVGSSDDIAPGTSTAQKQNFANWYSFYRTRALAAMSGAMSAVNALTNDSVRLGWQTINQCTTFGTDCDGYTSTNSENRIRTLTGARKTTFSNWLQRLDVTGSTPLRSAVKRAGVYFSSTGLNSPYAADPSVTVEPQHSCRKNFHVLFTDGLWNEDSGYTTPGGSADPDSSGTTSLPDSKSYSPRAPYRDVNVATSPSYTNSNGVADTAFYYWSNDLVGSLANNVPAYMSDLSGTATDQYWNAKNDPATWQHMTNYTIGLGLSASLVSDCYYNPDTLAADPNRPDPGCPVWGGSTFAGDYSALVAGQVNWPRINTSAVLNQEPDGHVYELWHAAINSRGKFYSADDPVALAAAFRDIMDTISSIADAGGGAGLSSNTTQIDEEGAVIYEAKFNADWSGRLLARAIADNYELGTIYWDAGQRIPAAGARKIFTLNDGVPQTFTADNCTDDLADALNKNGVGTPDILCGKRVNWLRGDGKVTNANWSSFNSADNTVTATFTVPDHGFATGDSVTVSDIAVSESPAPSFGYNGELVITVTGPDTFTATATSNVEGLGTYASGGRARYTQFRNRANSVLGDIMNSDPVYVSGGVFGGDDFGYGGGSVTLTGHSDYGAYVAAKSAFPPVIYVGANDGMLHAFRADVGDASSGAELFAYVPRGVYDNLSKLPEPSYTHRYFVDGPVSVGDAYLGTRWGTYLVSGLGAGGKSIFALDISNPTQFAVDDIEDLADDLVKWELTDPDDLGLTYSKPQIAPVDGSTWAVFFGNGYNSTNGSAYLYVVDLSNSANVTKVPIDTKGAPNADTDNGLSTPYLYDGNGDKIPDIAYAGDLKGYLWKFVNNAGAWELGNNGYPLFTARNATGQVQPITVQPKVGPGPEGSGRLVYFGTGSYLTTDDLTNNNTQTFYAVWDKDDAAPTRSLVRADLQGHTILTEETAFSYTVRTTSNETVDWESKRGWYLDLPASPLGVPSERIVSPALIMQFTTAPNRVLFVTTKPSSDPCSRGGTTWLMELDLITGGRTTDTVFDLNRDGAFTVEDKLTDASGNPVPASGVALPPEYGVTGEPLLLNTEEGDIVKEFSGSTGASGTASGPLQQGEPPGGGGGTGIPTPERVYWQQIR